MTGGPLLVAAAHVETRAGDHDRAVELLKQANETFAASRPEAWVSRVFSAAVVELAEAAASEAADRLLIAFAYLRAHTVMIVPIDPRPSATRSGALERRRQERYRRQ